MKRLLISHIVAYLHQLLDVSTLAKDKIYFFVIARMIIEDGFIGIVATAQ